MSAICSGPVVQTAWVTKDLGATEEHLSAHFGAGRWTRFEGIEFGPDTCELRGHPADFAADISLSYVGAMQLELIRPGRGTSIYHEFLEAGGPGLHHICFETVSMPATLEAAAAAGIEVVQRGSMAGLMEFAYLDGAAAGVPFVEIAHISPGIRSIFEQIRSGAST
ncbi:MAG TPA: VOC family protein [Acidimicrobiales bacterium]|nr:VOC family protein [Acidimicrobiales bacterium]